MTAWKASMPSEPTWAADLVGLLDLNREPVVGEHAAADGEDAAVHAHVAHLNLVGNPAQRNHRPVLELERRQVLELFNAPREIAHDEGIRLMRLPPRLALTHVAHVAQTLRHHAAGCR
jgi:hypothetical protein